MMNNNCNCRCKPEIVIKRTPIIINTQGKGIPGEDGRSPVFVATIYDLPTIGDAKNIYIVTSENATYRWEQLPGEAHPRYLCIGRDWKEIEIINGGEIK